MKVRVKLFAAARELADDDEVIVDLSEDATISNLKDAVLEKLPALRNIVAHSMWAVDASYVTTNTKVPPGSEVALIPPVSGG